MKYNFIDSSSVVLGLFARCDCDCDLSELMDCMVFSINVATTPCEHFTYIRVFKNWTKLAIMSILASEALLHEKIPVTRIEPGPLINL